MPEDAQGCPLPPAETPQARAARGETFSLDFTLPAADGSRCWYEANGQPLHNGGAGHAVVVIRDITLSSQHRRLVAQEEERRRVAYEVHDGLAATAASAHQHLQAFARHHRPRSPRAQEQFDRALELAQRTVREARRVVANLRPTTLDDLGLAAALRLQVEELQAEGWHVTYQEALGSERVPPLVETALFRVTQEALTNARKHAQTTEIHVRVERAEREVRLVVEDAGRGFVPEAITLGARAGERVGLAGMRERVVMLGGQCLVEGHLGAGTRVSVAIPLEPLAAEGMARDT